MKIGEVARCTQTPVETIRYYEREGLVPPPARLENNYRQYGAQHVERLLFIRHCRSLDMTLHEIRVLLRFRDAPHDNCAEVNALLDEHIGHVSARILELRSLEKQLRTLREACRVAREAQHCGILNELSEGARQAPAVAAAKDHVAGSHAVSAGARR